MMLGAASAQKQDMGEAGTGGGREDSSGSSGPVSLVFFRKGLLFRVQKVSGGRPAALLSTRVTDRGREGGEKGGLHLLHLNTSGCEEGWRCPGRPGWRRGKGEAGGDVL